MMQRYDFFLKTANRIGIIRKKFQEKLEDKPKVVIFAQPMTLAA